MNLANRHGNGAFRRRHVVVATAPDTVVAGVEDEMHRFELTLRHDGRSVTAIEGRAVRWPWSSCLDSPSALGVLVGMPLDTAPTALGRWADAREQCTHQFDLAGLAAAHAARHVDGGAERRVYDVVVPDWRTAPYVAVLHRDGVERLRWTIGPSGIESPEPFVGVPLRNRFIAWCEENLDHDTAEAAIVLRRGAWMSPARLIDLEACDTAAESHLVEGVCFTAQPQRIHLARRNRNTLRDYGASSDPLLAGFDPTA